MKKRGDRDGRPLIDAMSLRPVIPQRVARQQCPPPLHRLGTILRSRGVLCQSRVDDSGVILGYPGWGKESEVKDTELYDALLRLGTGWVVREVRLDVTAERVDVWIEGAAGARWASPGSQLSLRIESRLIAALKECDVTGVTRLMGTSWDKAWGIVEKAVARGLARKERRLPPYLCVDEKSFAKRHRYETLICDAQRGTVEYVVEDRRQESLEAYYRQFTGEELAQVRAIAMDMWDPYIAATHAYVPGAGEKMVFDKCHVLRTVNEAVDKVRRQEHQGLKAGGDERLKGTKHLWLANQENVPEWRRAEFEAVKGENLKTSRAWAIKESLRKFWTYRYAQRAADYFRRWYFWATHSRLTPVVSAAKTLQVHLRNILTYFRHRLTNATAEGLNSKIQMVKEMACGFRNREHYKTAIYFHCGGLDLYPRLEASA